MKELSKEILEQQGSKFVPENSHLSSLLLKNLFAPFLHCALLQFLAAAVLQTCRVTL